MDKRNFNTPLSLRNMQIKDPFWKGEMELVRTEVIPYQWNALNDRVEGAAPSFCMRNFKVAGKLNRQRREQGEAFQEQIDRIIEQSGRDVDETSREDARWLLEKGLPLTGENLDRMEELKGTELPASAEDFGEAAASATARGIDPTQSNTRRLTFGTENASRRTIQTLPSNKL